MRSRPLAFRLVFAGLVLAPAAAALAQQSHYEPRAFAPQGAVKAAAVGVEGSRPRALDAPTEIPSFPFRQVSAGEPTAPVASAPALKLTPRNATSKGALDRPAAPTPTAAINTVVSSLAIVLALFVVLVWLSKRFAPPGTAPLPREVVELLGRAPLAGRQSMQLIRVGNRLLLVALSAGGAETLTEISDPVEVEHLAGLCRRGKSDSASASFNRVLSQLATEPAGEVPRPRTRGAA